MRFLPYEPDQAGLLPPSVKDVLGEDHLCFFVHRVVERLDLSGFEQDYGEEGPPAYAPALMVKVWLYAYALGVTSSRRLEQRMREDLAFRYLAGGATPDHWTRNEFQRQHRRAINDLFTQVLEWARAAGLEARAIEGYVPDSNLARALKGGGRRRRAGRLHHAEQRRMRQRLRSPAGRAVYQRRKAIIEPVFGVQKEQRGMRRFRLRGLPKVAVEMALAATAYNLTRRWSHPRALA
jgi:transposase